MPTDTLSIERDRVMTQRWANGGTRCRCCGGNAQVYARSINVNMAIALIQLCRRPDPYEPIDVQEFLARYPAKTAGAKARLVKGEWPKLRHWGLIEVMEDGKCRVTPKGMDFAAGRIRIPKHVLLYLNEIVAPPPDSKAAAKAQQTCSIQDAFRTPFDYQTLMQAQVPYAPSDSPKE